MYLTGLGGKGLEKHKAQYLENICGTSSWKSKRSKWPTWCALIRTFERVG